MTSLKTMLMSLAIVECPERHAGLFFEFVARPQRVTLPHLALFIVTVFST